MMRFLLLLLIIVFGTGCSGKAEKIAPQEANRSVTSLIEVEDSFADEFENEFESQSDEVSDPLIGYNRMMTAFNDRVYRYALDPVATGYAAVVPQPARVGIANVFHNLKFPIHFTNNILQGKFDGGMKELARFMLNSTVGILGLIDVADYAGIEPHEEDFGQTLGYYGVGSGFHLVLPFLGPSNLRDTIGLGTDMYASPVDYTGQSYQIPHDMKEGLAIKTGYYINKNSLHLGEYESLKKDALDYYLFFRDAYEQQRKREIER